MLRRLGCPLALVAALLVLNACGVDEDDRTAVAALDRVLSEYASVQDVTVGSTRDFSQGSYDSVDVSLAPEATESQIAGLIAAIEPEAAKVGASEDLEVMLHVGEIDVAFDLDSEGSQKDWVPLAETLAARIRGVLDGGLLDLGRVSIDRDGGVSLGLGGGSISDGLATIVGEPAFASWDRWSIASGRDTVSLTGVRLTRAVAEQWQKVRRAAVMPSGYDEGVALYLDGAAPAEIAVGIHDGLGISSGLITFKDHREAYWPMMQGVLDVARKLGPDTRFSVTRRDPDPKGDPDRDAATRSADLLTVRGSTVEEDDRHRGWDVAAREYLAAR